MKRTAKIKTGIIIVGGGIFVLSAAMILIIGRLSFELVVPFTMLMASYGLVAKKEWGRRLIIPASALSLLIYLLDTFLITKLFDLTYTLYAITWVTAMAFYELPIVKKVYQDGFQTPLWRVLVVDDDRIFLKMINKNFFAWGILPLTAENGEEGMKLACKHKPDLIILDVILPKMKGRAVCSTLKEDAATRDIPVIFLTAKNSPDDVRAELEAGAITHIQKPIDFHLLHQEIQKILGS